jgi:hypothetical protein
LISQDLEIKSDCEIVVSRIECSKKKRPWLSSQCTDQHMIILFMRMLLQTPLSISAINIPWTPYVYCASITPLIGLHVVTRDGLFAAKISSMFCLFVGKFTNWFKPASSIVDLSSSFITFLH